MNRIAATLLSLSLLTGCGAGEAPTLQVLGASPEALDPARDDADDLAILVGYTDPNGDLGKGSAEVHDCRAEGLVLHLALPGIASQQGIDEGVTIEGELRLVVADVGAVKLATTPPARCQELGAAAPSNGARAFCVVLIDAAGNRSEGACTDPIPIASTGD